MYHVKLEKKIGFLKSRAVRRKLALEEQVKSLENKDSILIEASFSGKVGQPLVLTIKTETGLEATAASTILLEEALQHSLDDKVLRGQMRLGNTAYVLETLKNNIEGQCMVPKSILNQLRRECIEALDNAIVNEKRIMNVDLNLPVKGTDKIDTEVTVSTIAQLKLALEQGIESVFYPLIPFKGMEENLLSYLENKPDELLKRIGLVLSRVVREDEMPILEKAFNLYYPKIKLFKANTLDQLVFLKNRKVPFIR